MLPDGWTDADGMEDSRTASFGVVGPTSNSS